MSEKEQSTVFSKLRQSLKNVRADVEDKQEYYQQMNLDALEKVDDFIRSGVWSNAKSVNDLLLYIDLTSTDAALKTGKAPTTIRTQRANASRLLKRLLGEHFIDKCLSSDKKEIDSVMHRIEIIKILQQPVTDYVSNETIEHFYKEKSKKKYDFRDCEQEISILAELSVIHKENLYKKADVEKMSYLISVLLQSKVVGENKEPNVEQAKLIRLIEKKEKQISELSTKNKRLEQVVELYEEDDNSISDGVVDSFVESEFSDDDLEDNFLKED